MGLFVAEGEKLVHDFLASGIRAKVIFCSQPELIQSFPVAKVVEVSAEHMKSISFLESPSPVLAVFEQPQWNVSTFGDGQMVLLLDRVQDPGNVGTLLRAALWYGVREVAVVPGTVDLWNPKVVQASMGALAHVKSISLESKQWVEWAKESGRRIVVADLNGQHARTFNWPSKTLLVLGNEGQGVGAAFTDAADSVLTLPGDSARMESLNVGVSGATLLYEHAVSVGPYTAN